jgi:hypothetical protein
MLETQWAEARGSVTQLPTEDKKGNTVIDRQRTTPSRKPSAGQPVTQEVCALQTQCGD